MRSYYVIIAILIPVVGLLIWQLGSQTDEDSGYEQFEDQLVFKMAEHRTMEYPSNEGAHLFAELVLERTQGQVKIVIYDGYELGDESSIVEQIAYGGIDFARINGVYLDKYIVEMSVLCMPGLYEEDESMMKIFNDGQIGTGISESLKNEKINVLTWYPGSTRGIFYDEESIEDLAGGKIAIPTSQMKIHEMEAMGFTPIPALQDNVSGYLAGGYVLGAEGELLDYYYSKAYNKSKHFTKTKSRIPEAIVASNTALKQLTVEQQKIVIDAAIEAGLMTYNSIVEEEMQVVEELESIGCIIDAIYPSKAYENLLSELAYRTGDLELLQVIRTRLEEEDEQ